MKYIWINGEFVPADNLRPVRRQSSFPCPYIMADLPAYESPMSSSVVDGRAARREEMKRYNVREVDPSERPEGAGIPKTKAQAASERKQLEDRTKFQLSDKTKNQLLGG